MRTRYTWRSVIVDGETFYWTAYPSRTHVENGPWTPIEYLTVARKPNTAGVGAAHPAGATITEHDAVELIRLMKAHRRQST